MPEVDITCKKLSTLLRFLRILFLKPWLFGSLKLQFLPPKLNDCSRLQLSAQPLYHALKARKHLEAKFVEFISLWFPFFWDLHP